MRTKNTGIAATLASVTDRDDSAEASVPPPQYSEVWADPPQRTARPEIASVSVESLQGKAPEEQELLVNNQPAEREGPQRAPEVQSKSPTEPEAVYLTQPPDETKCCCCCGYPGARKYWSGWFRRSLRRQSSHDDGALMIKEAVESICGITRMHTEGVVFRLEHALAHTLAHWANVQAKSSVTAESMMGRVTIDQLALHIANGSRLLPPKGLMPLRR